MIHSSGSTQIQQSSQNVNVDDYNSMSLLYQSMKDDSGVVNVPNNEHFSKQVTVTRSDTKCTTKCTSSKPEKNKKGNESSNRINKVNGPITVSDRYQTSNITNSNPTNMSQLNLNGLPRMSQSSYSNVNVNVSGQSFEPRTIELPTGTCIPLSLASDIVQSSILPALPNLPSLQSINTVNINGHLGSSPDDFQISNLPHAAAVQVQGNTGGGVSHGTCISNPNPRLPDPEELLQKFSKPFSWYESNGFVEQIDTNNQTYRCICSKIVRCRSGTFPLNRHFKSKHKDFVKDYIRTAPKENLIKTHNQGNFKNPNCNIEFWRDKIKASLSCSKVAAASTLSTSGNGAIANLNLGDNVGSNSGQNNLPLLAFDDQFENKIKFVPKILNKTNSLETEDIGFEGLIMYACVKSKYICTYAYVRFLRKYHT